MSNVVLMFSPTDEKTPYERPRESDGRMVQLVGARSIVHKFLNFPRHRPSKHEGDGFSKTTLCKSLCHCENDWSRQSVLTFGKHPYVQHLI